jgi:hypothetical protein
MKTRYEIADGEKIEHKGDLTIEGNVGRHASLTITDGSLTIKGDVLYGANITLINKDKASGVFFSGGRLTVRGGHSVKIINGVTWIDGVLQNPQNFNKAPKEYQISILGSVHDKARIISDVEVNVANNVGEYCYIKCANGGLTAKEIGANTEVHTYGTIHATQIKNKCHLESTSYGINATEIHDQVNAKTYKDIDVKRIGNHCTLESTSYGVKADHTGQYNTIDSYKDINIGEVGDHNTLTSSSYGFNGDTVGKSVTIKTYKDITCENVGDNTKLTSDSYGIRVSQTTANNVTLQAYKDIYLSQVGNDCDITSSSYGVKVSGSAGDNLSIQAYKDIQTQNVGSNANITSDNYGVTVNNLGPKAKISAYKDIVVNGVCPSDARLKSERGKVRKYGPVREMSYFAPKAEEKKANVEFSESFICPISKKIMLSPVINIKDGVTYDDTAIRNKLIEEKGYNTETLNTILIPNLAMVDMIGKYLLAHPEQMAKMMGAKI